MVAHELHEDTCHNKVTVTCERHPLKSPRFSRFLWYKKNFIFFPIKFCQQFLTRFPISPIPIEVASTMMTLDEECQNVPKIIERKRLIMAGACTVM